MDCARKNRQLSNLYVLIKSLLVLSLPRVYATQVMARSYDYKFKVTLVGLCPDDKRELVEKFLQMPSLSSVSVVGGDILTRTIELDTKKIQMQLWNTAGLEKFQDMTLSYCRGAQGILMVYDITKRETFEYIRECKSDLDRVRGFRDAVLVLLGNKCHLQDQRQVSIEEGKQLAEEYGIKFFETSAEMDIQVELAFVTLAQAIREKYDTL